MARDAAEIKPKMIPDDALHGRDNSGGIDYKYVHTADFDDGGYVIGAKSYLSASGGGDLSNGDSKGYRKKERD